MLEATLFCLLPAGLSDLVKTFQDQSLALCTAVVAYMEVVLWGPKGQMHCWSIWAAKHAS